MRRVLVSVDESGTTAKEYKRGKEGRVEGRVGVEDNV
jgi:hypothetical protein